MGLALDHVVIHVAVWERSNAFYRDVLGAELVERDGSAARHYRFGDQQLNVHGPGTGPEPGGGAAGRAGRRRPLLRVGRPDRRRGAAPRGARRGAWRRGRSPATAGAGAARASYFRDPDGSLLEFLSYV